MSNGWTLRADEQARIKQKIETAIPDEQNRRAAMDLLAYAIENADDETASAWVLREIARGLSLVAGRFLVCRISRSKIGVSVMGPVDDDVRAALGAEVGENEEWKAIPDAIWLAFNIERAPVALSLLKEGLDKFVDEAMARVRRQVSLEQHSPEAVAYVASVVGRDLPQPSQTQQPAVSDDDDEESDPLANREPRRRGRAPIFNNAQVKISSLLGDIERKTMALPDLQRPFVWEDKKVRDLLDSLFVGFPVGTLVLWQTSDAKDGRSVGGPDALLANTLIIDGQQRLTSLYAVMRGAEVTERDGTKRKISIAFRPRDGRFAVADGATRNDPEFLSNVTDLWSGKRMMPQIRKDLLKALREKGRDVTEDYENAVEESLLDYLYLAQLPPLLFGEVWQDARLKFGGLPDAKQRLQSAIQQIGPVRNEIAHVREVSQDRLQKANVACGDVLGMLSGAG